jgi:hypothetical protein
MASYELYQYVGGYQYEKVTDYVFQSPPQVGDTIDLGKGMSNVWVVERRHWRVDGSTVLIVHRERMMK